MARHVETAAGVLAANVLGVQEGHDVIRCPRIRRLSF